MSFDSLLADPSIKELHTEGIAAIINRLGQTCLAHYPKTNSKCPNCQYDPVSDRSSGLYVFGGPRPFTNGTICPYCYGNGILEADAPSEELKLAVIWNPSDWMKLPVLATLDWKTPNSICQVYGFWEDVSKVWGASSITLSSDLSGTVDFRMERLGEALPQGLEPRFFVQMLKRIGS